MIEHTKICKMVGPDDPAFQSNVESINGEPYKYVEEEI